MSSISSSHGMRRSHQDSVFACSHGPCAALCCMGKSQHARRRPPLSGGHESKLRHCHSGTLPPELASLTSVHVVNIAGNNLTGQIPAAYFTASAFTYSTFLYLQQNRLTGRLPAITPSSCSLCRPRQTMPESQTFKVSGTT